MCSFISFAVCLSCWQGLCSDDGSFNAKTLCPCPCINSTLPSSVDKCGESGLASIPNSECCSKADMDFISKLVTPFIEKIEPNLTDSNTCPGAYNQLINFAISSYEEINSLKLNREYLYQNTPFTCSGCISSVTIYSKGQITSNVTLGVQLYRPSINITDNSTNVLQTMGQELNVTFYQDISQGQDNGAYYITKSVITGVSQSCFKPGDVFSVYIPQETQFDDILEEKSSSNPVYYRKRPSCESLRENYFLNMTDKRPLIVVSVTTTGKLACILIALIAIVAIES